MPPTRRSTACSSRRSRSNSARFQVFLRAPRGKPRGVFVFGRGGLHGGIGGPHGHHRGLTPKGMDRSEPQDPRPAVYQRCKRTQPEFGDWNFRPPRNLAASETSARRFLYSQPRAADAKAAPGRPLPSRTLPRHVSSRAARPDPWLPPPRRGSTG